MRILFASVEVAPFAKVGGLADVAGSLPPALKELGHDVKIVMPAYGMVVKDAELVLENIPVEVNPHWTAPLNVWKTTHKGVEVWMLGTPGTFDQTTKSEEVYAFGRDTYLFFAKACLAVCEAMEWIPEVINANDWHTGFLPVFLRESAGPKWAHTASTFTIHNLHYQGIFGADTLDAAGLPKSLFVSDKLETFGAVNFIKSACVYAEQVNTVSPTYAEGITTPEYGEGLWGLLGPMLKEGRLRGILNGIDYDFFNPQEDPFIEAPFSAENLGGKDQCKSSLQAELGLSQSKETPVLGVVSRLSDQKGFDLMIRQAYGMLGLGVHFVVLGTGDPWAAEQLRLLEKEWPNNVRFIERFDAPLAQRIYAGSDIFLMPSAFEPCGLGQMIACRYGTLPLVRKTGGLADTIFDLENGFVFEDHTARALFDTICRAIETFRNEPTAWNRLISNAMATDFSWSQRAPDYVKMYEDALAVRKSLVPA